jgi:nucleotide-binding universal stress UspA family protein
MSAPEPFAPIRRILIALDASAPSIAALEAAATLAERIDAELLGVFIEDVNLVHLAGLPFAAEIGMLSARARPLAPEEMERLLRLQRRRAEQALVHVAQRLSLRWSFRVARGQVVPELLAAAIEADLMALGATGMQTRRRAWLGSTTQAIIAQMVRPVLITLRGATLRPPIAVVCSDSAGSMQALALATYVAERLDGGELIVLLLVDDAEQEERLRQAVTARLARANAKARYDWLVEADVDELARRLRSEHAGTLVLASNVNTFGMKSVRGLLERTDVTVLIAGADQSVVPQSARTSAGS